MATINLFKGMSSPATGGSYTVDPDPGANLRDQGARQANQLMKQSDAIVQTIEAQNMRMEAEKQEYYNKLKASQDNLELVNAMGAVKGSMATYLGDRMKQGVDENGLPNFDPVAMLSEYDKVSQEVYNEAIKTISDPLTQARFKIAFAEYNTDYRIDTESKARGLQTKAQVGALQLKVYDLLEQTLKDPSTTWENGLRSIDEIIDHGTALGLLDPSAAFSMKRGMQDKVEDELRAQIATRDPLETLKALDDGVYSSLEHSDQLQMRRMAEATLKEQEVEAQKKAMQAERDQADMQDAVTTQLSIGMLDNQAGLVDIEKARGAMGEENYLKVKTEWTRKEAVKLKEMEANAAIAQSIQVGDNLSEFPKKDVEKSYQTKLAAVTGNIVAAGSENVNQLAVAGAIAAQYRAPIKSFQTDLETSVRTGDMSQKLAAYAAYNNIVTAGNDVALKGLDKQVHDQLTVARHYVEYGGMAPDKAMQTAATIVTGTDPDIQAERMQKFKESEFVSRDEDPEATMNKFLNEEVFDSEVTTNKEFYTLGIGSQNVKVDAGVRGKALDLMEYNFRKTGDLTAAKALTTRELKAKFGVSQLGSSSSIMYLPPEKVMPAGVSRESLNSYYSSYISAAADLPEGIDASKVDLVSDTNTKIINQGKSQVVTYYLKYKDEDGIELPVLTKDGRVLRFKLDSERLKEWHKKQTVGGN
jgi:hypothetical protein